MRPMTIPDCSDARVERRRPFKPMPETPLQNRQEYVIIAGHGRSGSNRLLDAFDCHPGTLCRNEPNEALGSAFKDLPEGFYEDENGDEDFLTAWRRAIAGARLEISDRDRLRVEAKCYARPALRRAFARQVLARRRVRQSAAHLLPALRRETWQAAPYYAAPGLLDSALPVFKILLRPGWIRRAFAAEPGMRVILNVRAPKPFLRSWRRRYVESVGPEKVYARNLDDLERLPARFGAPPQTLGAFSEEALFESELWRWRYVNEALYSRLKGEPRFTAITYEAFEADPAGETERLFDFAGLSFDESVRQRAASLQNTLFPKQPETGGPSEDFLDGVIERVLSNSPLQALWPDARPAGEGEPNEGAAENVRKPS